ncbi:MAG TPA: hypothetical protein VG847_00935 [Chitinophagaceae bacterium]|nr:hypothetical protein [Chitinophagaceae bacterium]
MSVRTDVINLITNINGDQAQDQLNKLAKKAQDLTAQMSLLKKGTQEYTDTSKALKDVNDRMHELRVEIGYTALTQKELIAELNELKALQSNVQPFTNAFNELQAKIDAVKTRLADVRAGVEGFTETQKSLVAGASKFEEGFIRIFQRVGEYVASFNIYEKVADFLKGIVDETNAAEQASSNLKNSLENVGRIDLFETMALQAEDFAKAYKAIDPNDIKNVFSKLIDYGKLSQSQITSLTDVIINYARKQNISVTEASDIFTRALENNGKGLKTYGVNIQDATTFAGRLNLILGPMAEKVKGAETAFEETTKGGLEAFKEKIKQIQTTIGTFVENLVGLGDQSLKNAVNAKKEADSAQALVDEYESLNKKTNQTTADKTRLQQITASLEATFGDSVVQINKETGALELNLQATKDLITQKLLLANSKAAEEAAKYRKEQEDLTDATSKLSIAQKAYNILVQQTGVTYDDVIKKASVVGSTDILSNTEKQVLALGDQLNANNLIIKVSTRNITDLTKTLNDLGFKIEDVNKLFNPKPLAPTTDTTTTQELNKYKELLKEAQDFYKQIQYLAEQDDAINQGDRAKEIEDVKIKYQKLLDQANNYYKKHVTSSAQFKQEQAIIEKASEDEVAALRKKFAEEDDKLFREQFGKNEDDAYQEAIRKSDNYYATLKADAAKNFADGIINEAQYNDKINAIDAESFEQKKAIAQDYASTSKKAKEDEVTFNKQAEEQKTKDDEEQGKAREQLLKDDTKARQELNNIIINDPRSTLNKKASAQIDNAFLLKKDQLDDLREQFQKAGKDFDDASLAASSEGQAIWTNFYATIQKIDDDTLKAKLNNLTTYAEYTNEIFSQINTIITNSENKQLAKEQASNTAKQASLQKLLNAKLISQKQYDAQTQALSDQQDAQDKKIKQDQAKRQKALDLFSAIINTAKAVTEALPNLVLAGVVGGVGLAEIAAIASEPPPSAGQGKLLTDGPYHRDKEKGLHVVNPRTGKTELLLEKEEMVINGNATRSNATHTITGTPRQIGSKINSMYGGVSWASGAQVSSSVPRWMSTPPRAIQPLMPRIMAQGGIVPPLFNKPDSTIPAAANIDFSGITDQLLRSNDIGERNNQLIEQLLYEAKKPKKNYVTIKDINDQQARYDASRRASGIN